MAEHDEQEVLETLRRYLEVRGRIEAHELGWDSLAQFFTDDAVFVDPAWGRVEGRENIRTFFIESMEGLEDWTFPHEWEFVDGDRLTIGWQNRLPGRRDDGGYWQAPGVSRMIYARDGKFSFEQDLLNMVHVFEIMKESGWKPSRRLHSPPKKPVRLFGWEP